MKNLLTTLVFFFSLLSIAQQLIPSVQQVAVEPIPVVTENKNWTSSISYDFSGATVSKGVQYFNDLGSATQSQSWDVLTGRIWGQEVRYDTFSRPFFQTLSAPIGSAGFGYKNDFIYAGGTPLGSNLLAGMVPFTYTDWFTGGTYSGNYYNPIDPLTTPCVSDTPNSLGWYYSNNNSLDPYQDTTCYPYTKTLFSDLNPGTVKAVYGGNQVNGQWLQSYSFTMPIEKNSAGATSDIPSFVGKRITKTVARGVDGIEAVVFTDTDGNTIGAARSGNEATSTGTPRSVYSEIIDKGFVDIHIPVGCAVGNNVTVTNMNPAVHSMRVYNLVTDSRETTVFYYNQSTTFHLDAGFYRFEDANNYYGKSTTPVVPVRINYSVNYYDYSINEYDLADRLVKSTQPLGSNSTTPLASSFEYNSLNQLQSTTSPDEGTSKFKYRKDGQIRFSQNAEQAKNNSFSYTNYDNLGRPVESGVYKGTEIYFDNEIINPADNMTFLPCVDAIIDQLDGLPTDGRSEQNFSVYDIADNELSEKLEACFLPATEYQQKFVASNVSNSHTENPFTTKSWYSYDVYGRVTWMVQEIPGLTCLKTIDYTYSPVNGQITQVDYQRHDATERFVHKYDYNIAGQLIDVSTSTDNVAFTHQAHYIYNESGALTRTELADNLQGIDYVYNLEGQLKAINHPTILPDLDPGSDGAAGAHANFSPDAFGMAIDYYAGDYTRTNTPKPITTNNQGTDQYNGNIKSTRWNTQVASANHSGYQYQYNKNNWLTQASFGTANQTGSIVPNPSNDYKVSNITYDANGNIQTLNRKGYTSATGTNQMDDFNYRYKSTSAAPASNRLLSVKDTQDNPDPNRYADLKNQERTATITTTVGTITTTQTTQLDNYIYNDLGQLTANLQDKILYDYDASGLVTKISTFANETTNEADEYKMIFTDDYSHWTSFNHGWTKVGINNIAHAFENGFPLEDEGNCQPTLTNPVDIFSLYGKVLQINGKISARKFFRVTPNTTYKLNFDVILDNQVTNPNQHLIDADGNPIPSTPTIIVPSVTINLKKPDGTVFDTQTITASTAEYCNRYFDEHINKQFTTATEEYVTLELVINNNLNSLNQKTFIDNLQLEAATNTKVAFYYNDRGQRVLKETYGSYHNKSMTYYVRDASGNVMGVYTHAAGPTIRVGPPRMVENTIFGASRIGIFKRTQSGKSIVGTSTGISLYELTDHLGNVRAVIQKTPTGLLSLTNKTDYYPFGSAMPNKTTTDGLYRYAFQGQELDKETGMEAFELRLWDGRLGRWLTVDPKGEFNSPYLGMGNNPISTTDPDGGHTDNDYHTNSETGKTTEIKTNDKFDRFYIDGEFAAKIDKSSSSQIVGSLNISRSIDLFKDISSKDIPYAIFENKIIGVFKWDQVVGSQTSNATGETMIGLDVSAGYIDLSGKYRTLTWYQTRTRNGEQIIDCKIDGKVTEYCPFYPVQGNNAKSPYSKAFLDFSNTTNKNSINITWIAELSLIGTHKATGVQTVLFTYSWGYKIDRNNNCKPLNNGFNSNPSMFHINNLK